MDEDQIVILTNNGRWYCEVCKNTNTINDKLLCSLPNPSGDDDNRLLICRGCLLIAISRLP